MGQLLLKVAFVLRCNLTLLHGPGAATSTDGLNVHSDNLVALPPSS